MVKQMWLMTIVMCLAVLGVLPSISVEAATIYVDCDASGNGDGSSWTNACPSLDVALRNADSGSEIWVAAGSYRPTDGTDKTISFELKDGVGLYGGFAGTENIRGDRDPSTNVTILTGDIGDLDNLDDNSYHVVTCFSIDETVVLDGFTITGGYAQSADVQERGGGMYNAESNLTVTDCKFINNSADWGGGMYNVSSDLTVTDCTFSYNSSGHDGGGMYNVSSDLSVTDCTFSYNNSQRFGAGMVNGYSNSTVTDCRFINNSADTGAGMVNGACNPTITGCTFSNNSAGTAGVMYNEESNPTITGCTFSNNSAGAAGVMYNGESNPTVTDCTFSNNSAGAAGVMYNGESNPTVTDCTFSNNSADDDGGVMYNHKSNPAVTGCTFSNNSANFASVMFNIKSSPMVTDCTFNGNITGVMSNIAESNSVVTNCTFSDNSTGSVGVMCNDNSDPVVKNCIFWDICDIEISNTGGSSPDISFCIVSGDCAGTNIISSDPMLAPLADNGGPTWTCALQPESPAVDAGLPLDAVSKDQRGVSRPQGRGYDIGAYEYRNDSGGGGGCSVTGLLPAMAVLLVPLIFLSKKR